ncbi:MAG: AgmX/PglI C-terminal domain-containing protein [Polyangiaceae bacterium]
MLVLPLGCGDSRSAGGWHGSDTVEVVDGPSGTAQQNAAATMTPSVVPTQSGAAAPATPSVAQLETASASASGLVTRPPNVRGDMGATGKLPPEVIQRVIRQNFSRVRLCYEEGLKKDPKLAGRVTINFVIGRDGSACSVSGGGVPDAALVNCVTKTFYTLKFPKPEGGIVKVTYPIEFQPD